METETTYESGAINGLVKVYNDNGHLLKTIPYQFNRNTGVETAYFLSGKKQSEITYLNGQKSGRYTEYFETGEIKIKGNHLYDVKQGTWNYFDKAQKILKTETYSRGQLMSTTENE